MANNNLYAIMKIYFKHWWSTIPPLSTKRITTSHIKPLYTKRLLQCIVLEIPGLKQAQPCGGVKHLMGYQTRSDNWISNDNVDNIYKLQLTIKNLHRFASLYYCLNILIAIISVYFYNLKINDNIIQ